MIELPRDVYDDIVEHARDGSPEEVCGVLGGDYGEDLTRVASARRAENAAETPRIEYDIDPSELLELVETVEAAGRDVAGFYHSHPEGPPRPSETDADRAAWPGVSYLIVALDGAVPYVGSWRWNADAEAFEQETLAVR